MTQKSKWQVCGVLCLTLVASLALAQPHHGDHRYVRPPPPRVGYTHYDLHYGHNHYYPARGFTVSVLPSGYVTVNRYHERFFFSGGIWYAARGPGFVVVSAPIGAYVSVLPPAYTTVWVGGLPYYYANDTYYEWSDAQHAYQVVDPPAGAEEGDVADTDQGQGQGDTGYVQAAPQSGAAPSGDLFVYPVNGQSEQQQSQDKWECHQWAVGQTGFDPTTTGGGVPTVQNKSKRAEYQRAFGACLQGRGYSVK